MIFMASKPFWMITILVVLAIPVIICIAWFYKLPVSDLILKAFSLIKDRFPSISKGQHSSYLITGGPGQRNSYIVNQNALWNGSIFHSKTHIRDPQVKTSWSRTERFSPGPRTGSDKDRKKETSWTWQDQEHDTFQNLGTGQTVKYFQISNWSGTTKFWNSRNYSDWSIRGSLTNATFLTYE